MPIAADLAEPNSPAGVVQTVRDELGRIDVLANNAAFIETGPLDEISAALVDQHYAVNVRAPLLLIAAALPELRASGDGAIVNVNSSVGSIVKPGNMLYGSTKCELEYM